VRQQQTSTQQAVAAATEAAQQELQGARSAWQSGEAGRRVKFLARKAEEAKAVTLEGLAPEIEALKVQTGVFHWRLNSCIFFLPHALRPSCFSTLQCFCFQTLYSCRMLLLVFSLAILFVLTKGQAPAHARGASIHC
jgi:hypothetical protein